MLFVSSERMNYVFVFFWCFYLVKGPTVAIRAASKWRGVMTKLHGLSPCLLYSVLYVVCYQSVTRNANNISGYVYNRELITQPSPISHSPGKFKFSIRLFFFKLMFLGLLSKIV